MQRRLSWRMIIYRTKPQGTMGHYMRFVLFIVYPCHYFFSTPCSVRAFYASCIHTWCPLHLAVYMIFYLFPFCFYKYHGGFPRRCREISFRIQGLNLIYFFIWLDTGIIGIIYNILIYTTYLLLLQVQGIKAEYFFNVDRVADQTPSELQT